MMNMKRTAAVFCCLLALVLLLSACGNGTAENAGAQSAPAGAGPASEADGNTSPSEAQDAGAAEPASAASDPDFAAEGWKMTLDNGTVIPLGAVASETLAALGEPSDLMEAPSCIREGFDRVYFYGSAFTLTTAPDAAGEDRITEVTLTSDAVAVVENGVSVMIGSAVSDADAAFGEPSEDTGLVRRYAVPGGTLTVTAADGEITGITADYGG